MGPRRSRKGSGHPLCDRLPLTLAQRAMLLGTLPLQRVHALKSCAAGTGKCDIVRHAKCVDVRVVKIAHKRKLNLTRDIILTR